MQFSVVVDRFIVKAYLNSIFTNEVNFTFKTTAFYVKIYLSRIFGGMQIITNKRKTHVVIKKSLFHDVIRFIVRS